MHWLVDLIQSIGVFGWLVIAACVLLMVLISLVDRHPRPSDRNKRRRD